MCACAQKTGGLTLSAAAPVHLAHAGITEIKISKSASTTYMNTMRWCVLLLQSKFIFAITDHAAPVLCRFNRVANQRGNKIRRDVEEY